MVPRTDPERTIEALGRLMWALQGVSLVVCVDQLEDMAHLDRDAERFRRAVGTVCALAERVPSSLFVISCLEDLYPPLKRSLTRSFIDRLERDPEPLKLHSLRSWDEIVGLVGQRLRFLYESADVDFDESDPTYPIPRELLEQITNIRTRDVLDWCRTYKNRMADGLEVAAADDQSPLPGVLSVASFSGDLGEQIIHLTQLWNDSLAEHRQPPPDDDDRLGTLLGWAIQHVSREVDTGHRVLSSDEDGKCSVKVQGDAGILETLKIGVCNKSPLGGALSRQVDEIQTWAGDDVPVLVRSTDFPDNPKTKIAQQIAAVVAVGGRRVVVEDSDWRAMRAMQTFLVQYEQEPGFADWLQTERPLAQLKSLREILDLDALTVLPSAANANRQSRLEHEQAAQASSPSEAAESDWQAADQIPIGMSHRGRVAPVGVTLNELTQHVALLGGSGSVATRPYPARATGDIAIDTDATATSSHATAAVAVPTQPEPVPSRSGSRHHRAPRLATTTSVASAAALGQKLAAPAKLPQRASTHSAAPGRSACTIARPLAWPAPSSAVAMLAPRKRTTRC
jgi:hypothetical protein